MHYQFLKHQHPTDSSNNIPKKHSTNSINNDNSDNSIIINIKNSKPLTSFKSAQKFLNIIKNTNNLTLIELHECFNLLKNINVKLIKSDLFNTIKNLNVSCFESVKRKAILMIFCEKLYGKEFIDIKLLLINFTNYLKKPSKSSINSNNFSSISNINNNSNIENIENVDFNSSDINFYSFNIKEFITEKLKILLTTNNNINNTNINTILNSLPKTFIVTEDIKSESIYEFLIYLELTDLKFYSKNNFLKILEKVIEKSEGTVFVICLFLIIELINLDTNFNLNTNINNKNITDTNLKIKESIQFYNEILKILKNKINLKNKKNIFFINYFNYALINSYSKKNFNFTDFIINILKSRLNLDINNSDTNTDCSNSSNNTIDNLITNLPKNNKILCNYLFYNNYANEEFFKKIFITDFKNNLYLLLDLIEYNILDSLIFVHLFGAKNNLNKENFIKSSNKFFLKQKNKNLFRSFALKILKKEFINKNTNNLNNDTNISSSNSNNLNNKNITEIELYNHMKYNYSAIDEVSYEFKQLIIKTYENEIISKDFYAILKNNINNFYANKKIIEIENLNKSLIILFLVNEPLTNIWEFLLQNYCNSNSNSNNINNYKFKEEMFKIFSEIFFICINNYNNSSNNSNNSSCLNVINFYKSNEYFEKLLYISKSLKPINFIKSFYGKIENILNFNSTEKLPLKEIENSDEINIYKFCIKIIIKILDEINEMYNEDNIMFIATSILKFGSNDEVLLIKKLCFHKKLDYDLIMEKSFDKLLKIDD